MGRKKKVLTFEDLDDDAELTDEEEMELLYNRYHHQDDIPEGCAACGGPYPNCKISCPIFDD